MPTLVSSYVHTFVATPRAVYTWTFDMPRYMKSNPNNYFVMAKTSLEMSYSGGSVPAVLMLNTPAMCAFNNYQMRTTAGAILSRSSVPLMTILVSSGAQQYTSPSILTVSDMPQQIELRVENMGTGAVATTGTAGFAVSFNIFEMEA